MDFTCKIWKEAPPKESVPRTPEHRAMHQHLEKLKLQNGKLYRNVNDGITGEVKKQLTVPTSNKRMIIEKLHDKMGHQGRDRTLTLLQDRFYWYGMTRDVDNWISKCDRCIKRKTPANQRATMVSITTSQPLELVCMDFLSLETSKGGFHYILVITDHFTKYSVAVPTRNTTARTTAEAFLNNFVVHYGFPSKIHSDQ